MLKFKRFLALVCCLVVVVLAVPVQVHADPLTAGAAASIFQLWSQSYGMQVGGATFGFSSIDENRADTWITDLFDQWQSSEVSGGHQSSAKSIASFVSESLANVVMQKVYLGVDSPIGNAYGLSLKIGDTVSSSLDRFWNWLLNNLGFSYNHSTGKWENGNFDEMSPITMYSRPGAGPLPYSATNTYSDGWMLSGSYNNNPLYFAANSTNCYVVQIDNDISTGYPCLCFVSLASSEAYQHAGSWNGISRMSSIYSVGNTSYYYKATYSKNYSGMLIPVVSGGYQEACQFVDGILNGTIDNPVRKISLDTYGDDTADGELPFPKARDNPDYAPAPVDVNVSVPWDPAWDTLTGDALGEAVGEAAQDRALRNELDLTEEVEAPPIDNTDTIGPAGDYVVPGLSTVFPFCIPFDIYNFLSALAAEPAAPSFSCTLAFPAALGGPQTVVIDFDTPVFNQLAQLLRLLELLAFIVGLAFVTRSMFLRG